MPKARMVRLFNKALVLSTSKTHKMIVIIQSLDGTFHYCLAPVCMSKNIHDYINHIRYSSIMLVDFHLEPYEIGQIMGGN